MKGAQRATDMCDGENYRNLSDCCLVKVEGMWALISTE